MDLKRMGRISGFVAAVAMLAMVLQGCGGDGNGSGISQDMYDALQAELDVAEAAQMTAEDAAAAAMTAQTMAETARDAALEAQTMAETARDAALEAQAMAMTEAADAMAAEAAAEMARQAAVTAQQIAAQAEMDARAAEMAAQTALEAAETMRDMYQQGQMDAEAERDMYMQAVMDAETAADAAEAAQMTADNARIAAETALAVAKQAEMDAVQARMEAETARDDYKAKLDTANEELEDLKMAMMDADDAADAAAEAAQRARIDAAAIARSADDVSITTWDDANEDGQRDPGEVTTEITNEPMADFQSSEDRPVDMSLTATNDGSMVTFTATKGTGNDKEELFSFPVPAAASGDTSGMDVVMDLPGGHDKHIFLVTDIEAAGTRPFPVDPDGLETRVFHPGTQAFRYLVTDTDGDNEGLQNDDMMIYPGTLEPTDQVPTQEVLAKASFNGTFADSPGMYLCDNTAGTGEAVCGFGRDSNGDLTITGAWVFVPSDAGPDPDIDYLVFGGWLKRPDAHVGTGYSAGLGTGSDKFTVANVSDLVGKATYNGSAAGFFAERHVASDEAVWGTFTAIAALTADFDADDAGTDDATDIEGMITDFERSDAVDVNWVVELETIQILNSANTGADAADGAFDEGGTSGHASGVPWEGQWGVQMVGNGADTATHPGGLVGTFGASRGSSAQLVDDPTAINLIVDSGFVGVIGGFGARKVAE